MTRMNEHGLDLLRLAAASRDGECLSTRYMGAQEKYHFRCAKGHDWLATYANVTRGTWCPFCAGRQFDRNERLKDAQRLAVSKRGQCLSETIVKSNDLLCWRCAEGHEWLTTYSSILQGSWCAVCAGLKVDASERLRAAHEVAEGKGGMCLSDSYTGVDVSMYWRCSKGHEWKANYGRVVGTGSWCPYCAGKRRLPSASAQNANEVGRIKSRRPKVDPAAQLRAAQELAGAKGGVCLSASYLGSDQPLLWKCKRGHEWEAKYYNVVGTAGTWCPICTIGLKERLARHAIEQLFGVSFKKHRPDWLRNPKTGSLLELDGFNPELNLAFEYQGEQHYVLVNGFQMDASDLQINQYRDAIKRSLCRSHGIEILEIPYTVEGNDLLEWVANEIATNPKLMHFVPRMRDWRLLTLTEWVESDTYTIESLQDYAVGKGGECLSAAYLGTSSQYHWRCSQGHEWKATWANVKHKSSWCPVCSGSLIIEPLSQLQQIAKSKGGKCLSEEYLGARAKLDFECGAKHKWQATPDSIKRGSWCIACLGRIGPDEQLKMIKEVAVKKGGRCLSDRYLGGNEKLRFRCAIGHEWTATPNNVKRISWCPVCAKQRFQLR